MVQDENLALWVTIVVACVLCFIARIWSEIRG